MIIGVDLHKRPTVAMATPFAALADLGNVLGFLGHYYAEPLVRPICAKTSRFPCSIFTTTVSMAYSGETSR